MKLLYNNGVSFISNLKIRYTKNKTCKVKGEKKESNKKKHGTHFEASKQNKCRKYSLLKTLAI